MCMGMEGWSWVWCGWNEGLVGECGSLVCKCGGVRELVCGRGIGRLRNSDKGYLYVNGVDRHGVLVKRGKSDSLVHVVAHATLKHGWKASTVLLHA